MNGAESLLRTLVNNDITTCFLIAQPGYVRDAEMHERRGKFVAAADRVPDMRCVLCLPGRGRGSGGRGRFLQDVG